MVVAQDGVKMIYPPTLGGENWFLNPSNINNDPRFLPGTILDGDSEIGYTAMTTVANLWVKTSTGFTVGAVSSNVDHGELSGRGYMLSQQDWKDTEMTTYVKFVSGDQTLAISMQCRGANEDGVHNCASTKYLTEIGFDGRQRFGKKQWNISQINKDWTDTSVLKDGKDTMGQGWFGIKFMAYNIGIGTGNPSGNYGVKLETWIDYDNNNNWVKVAETVDSGGWGNTDNCGANVPTDQIISWGGPLAVFNFYNLGEIRFKLLSVRSISPGGDFNVIGELPTGVTVGILPSATTRVFASLKMHYRIGVVAAPTCLTEEPDDPNPPPPPPPAGNVTLIKKLANGYDIVQ